MRSVTGSCRQSLTEIDISAEVLNFQWTSQDGGNPAFAPNFESLARKHRFQTLGLACHRYNIRSLLLAHHEDDQAETLLMRLINGHKMLGLTGMKAVAEIPECHGIYGAHQSVEIRNFGAEQFQQPQMTSGGVKVYRPLLNFNKARLRATCEDANMEWFEDHTNQDPALTMRNSVRKLYRSHKLPPALSKSSLLALSQRARQRHSSQLDIVNRFLTACQMSKFETKSGILQIQFPDIRTFKVDTAIYSAEQLRMPAAMLLRRVIKIITPNEHVELAALTSMLPHVFPETFAADVTSSLPPNKRTIAGVQFDPISSSSTQKPEWLISRQNAPRPKHKTVLSVLDSKSCSWTPWAMIDGRYWLRVKDDMERSLTVELLGPQQLGAFLSGLDEKTRKSLKRDLKEFAPGNIRWTLLALIHEERVVALPTLCYKALGQEGLQWEVLYKKVDLEGLVKKE